MADTVIFHQMDVGLSVIRLFNMNVNFSVMSKVMKMTSLMTRGAKITLNRSKNNAVNLTANLTISSVILLLICRKPIASVIPINEVTNMINTLELRLVTLSKLRQQNEELVKKSKICCGCSKIDKQLSLANAV
ncbi:hypothetical protein F7734_51000 [Scytonema sp. UIC 10036]|uniref:hypothetical protein n=1 Tax=Scytonema sp. UIC 10036 TaxID=2304196 RepID=UPI0012DA60DD|nr:hypothetical protein [Scytonema sp. UIC 10036]MUH00164.1 hypothetical protein [Scytonema sp. UIC 10036]